MKGETFYWDIPRPKKPLLLPKVLSKEKIAALINAIDNQKHKTIVDACVCLWPASERGGGCAAKAFGWTAALATHRKW